MSFSTTCKAHENRASIRGPESPLLPPKASREICQALQNSPVPNSGSSMGVPGIRGIPPFEQETLEGWGTEPWVSRALDRFSSECLSSVLAPLFPDPCSPVSGPCSCIIEEARKRVFYRAGALMGRA